MPSRAAHLIAFLSILAISVSCHALVYRRFRGVLRKDFPRYSSKISSVAKYLFIALDIPFAYLFFAKHIRDWDISSVQPYFMYPFAVWQILMLVWAVILVPQEVIKLKSVQRAVVKPIVRQVRRFIRPRSADALPQVALQDEVG